MFGLNILVFLLLVLNSEKKRKKEKIGRVVLDFERDILEEEN